MSHLFGDDPPPKASPYVCNLSAETYGVSTVVGWTLLGYFESGRGFSLKALPWSSSPRAVVSTAPSQNTSFSFRNVVSQRFLFEIYSTLNPTKRIHACFIFIMLTASVCRALIENIDLLFSNDDRHR